MFDSEVFGLARECSNLNRTWTLDNLPFQGVDEERGIRSPRKVIRLVRVQVSQP